MTPYPAPTASVSGPMIVESDEASEKYRFMLDFRRAVFQFMAAFARLCGEQAAAELVAALAEKYPLA